jgi:hypothetical protein
MTLPIDEAGKHDDCDHHPGPLDVVQLVAFSIPILSVVGKKMN